MLKTCPASLLRWAAPTVSSSRHFETSGNGWAPTHLRDGFPGTGAGAPGVGPVGSRSASDQERNALPTTGEIEQNQSINEV